MIFLIFDNAAHVASVVTQVESLPMLGEPAALDDGRLVMADDRFTAESLGELAGLGVEVRIGGEDGEVWPGEPE